MQLFMLLLACLHILLCIVLTARSSDAFVIRTSAHQSTAAAAAAQQQRQQQRQRSSRCLVCAIERPPYLHHYVNDKGPEHGPVRTDFFADGSGHESARRQAATEAKSFTRWMEVEAWRRPEIAGMTDIMYAVEKACRVLGGLVRRAQTDDLAGMYNDRKAEAGAAAAALNIQGEAQKMLDVTANTIMVAQLCSPGGMSCVASEEEEYPQLCSAVVGHHEFTGEYAAVFDPLDGSANIGAGLPCGTIFGILKRPVGGQIGPRTILQPGRKLLAAGYCLYGGQTNLVLTLGNGVHGFTFDAKLNDFVLTQPNMRIPQRGVMYSANESNSYAWDGRIQDYVDDLKRGTSNSGRRYDYRYNGALIADIHNILHYGGIFMYPADNSNPNGKLRLLYEGNPIAMIMEQAGGAASTGFERILDVPPQSTHQRIPAFFGSSEDVYDLCGYMRRPL